MSELIEERTELQSKLGGRHERIDALDAKIEELLGELDQRPVTERASKPVKVLSEEFGVSGDNSGKRRLKCRRSQERIDEREATTEKRCEEGYRLELRAAPLNSGSAPGRKPSKFDYSVSAGSMTRASSFEGLFTSVEIGYASRSLSG